MMFNQSYQQESVSPVMFHHRYRATNGLRHPGVPSEFAGTNALVRGHAEQTGRVRQDPAGRGPSTTFCTSEYLDDILSLLIYLE